MALYKIISQATVSQFFPLNFEGTEMKPNILLMCKLMFILLIVHGFYNYINDPYIPFISFFDWFNNFPNVFKIIVRILFILSGLFLIFNYRVKLMSVILGLSVCTILLASKPEFANHYFICGCVFILSGLTHKNDKPWLLYIQLSLVYFGAVINKVLQTDWWNGAFMYNWLVNARENQLFISTSQLLPAMWLAKILSWSSMFIEFTIAFLLFFKRKHNLVVWLIIIFHSILYSLTAFRFGHFYEDIVIYLLIFLNWPKDKLKLKSHLNIFENLYDLCLLTNVIIIKTSKINKYLSVEINKETYNNWNGLRKLLIYNTNFYLFLFFLDLFIRFLFNGFMMNVIHLALIWVCILFFTPMIFIKKPLDAKV